MKVKYLILGGGVSGVAFAHFLNDSSYLLLEREDSLGGYCKTVRQGDFVWDYAGHFLHFKDAEIKEYLEALLAGKLINRKKDTKIYYKGSLINYPFQKNIHQLPKSDFIECLHDLYFRPTIDSPKNFKEMLLAKFGKGICERFLYPYNEKLYAIDLDALDVDAMGRFFPYADIPEIIRNFKEEKDESYNAQFECVKDGIYGLIQALLTRVDESKIRLNSPAESVDLDNKTVTANGEIIEYEHLISTVPFDTLLQLCSISSTGLSANKVLVFNLGFDKGTDITHHWIYYPETEVSFYRVGFYNNILGGDKLSLYVEIGYSRSENVNQDELLSRVLQDLHKVGILSNHKLIEHHSVMLDPAYAHISTQSQQKVKEVGAMLKSRGAHLLGRYAEWTYCAIGDNISAAKRLVRELQ